VTEGDEEREAATPDEVGTAAAPDEVGTPATPEEVAAAGAPDEVTACPLTFIESAINTMNAIRKRILF